MPSRILVLNFFPAFYPPKSGGEQRYYHLYNHLSRYYDVTLLSATYPEYRAKYELIEFSDTFREHRIPKQKIFTQLHHQLESEGIGPECSAIVCALAASEFTNYSRKYDELVEKADIIIHEFPYMLKYDRRFGLDGKPRIYNSHNLEANLVAQIIKGPTREKYIKLVRELENELVGNCDLLFATSREEKQQFVDIYQCAPEKIALAPNGFEKQPGPITGPPGSDSAGKIKAVFLGSGHLPNKEAADFICEQLAPSFPEIDFIIMGSVCEQLTCRLPNLELKGLVSETDKMRIFRQCRIALNPMRSGAGTNVKMLDFMAAGLAVVTTPIGARGLEAKDRHHFIIADLEEFPEKLRMLAHDDRLMMSLSASAVKLANELYSWQGIARQVHETLEKHLRSTSSLPRKSKKPNILLLNDYPLGEAAAGGPVRIRELFSRISNKFNICLLSLSNTEQSRTIQIADGFREISIPKTPDHKRLEKNWSSRHPISVNDLLAFRQAPENLELLNTYQELLSGSDMIILEHPYMSGLIKRCPPAPGIPVIYEAHNYESRMKKELLREHPKFDELLKLAKEAENTAFEAAEAIVCVSENDLKDFIREFPNKKSFLIENGINTLEYENSLGSGRYKHFFHGYPVALFLGSAHPPNIEAVNFILEKLCPVLPEVYFLIVGSVGSSFTGRNIPNNLVLCNQVETEVKNVLVSLADIAINPMFSGGGSSLKIAEYMAAGIPIVSTPYGARGFALPENLICIATADDFAEKLGRLLDDKPCLRRMAARGREFAARHLDWSILAQKYISLLQGLTNKPATCGRQLPERTKQTTPPNGDNRKRLLVVTYRLNEPPLGGAEVYLKEILSGIRKEGDFAIDIATIAISTIENHLHFSARYAIEKELNKTHKAEFDYADNVYKFPLDQTDEDEQLSDCKKLFSLWMEESREQARKLLSEGQEPILLGGWFFPETEAGKTRRWSSERGEIFLPPGTSEIHFRGFCNQGKTLQITFDDKEILSLRIKKGEFSFKTELPAAERELAGILALSTTGSYYGRDPRSLGICIESINVANISGNKRPVSIQSDFSNRAIRDNPENWVASLIRITQKRSPEVDVLFTRTRGPHSHELTNWLRENIPHYDLVLAHGVPFAPATVAGKIAVQCKIPYVCLPHFHMEDRYYHWQSFYRLFRQADFIIAFPRIAIDYFFSRINAAAEYFPGGGIKAKEFAETTPGLASRFRKMYNSPLPFFLVLGRKTGSKNYRMVMDAVAAVNRPTARCALVIIGRDEDHETIDQEHVFYLGSQPDEVVKEALANCTALVNMSESESFGIVLLEAWMSRRPVVANRKCLAFRELVEEGKTGFLRDDPASLSQAMKRLLNHPELAGKMGEEGYKQTMEQYEWQAIAARLNQRLLATASRN